MLKYFLDPNGVPTKRMANVAGKGHFDIAAELLGQDQGDLYAQMFALRYARVVELDDVIYVETKKPLTREQRNYLDSRRFENSIREVVINDTTFMESKDSRRLVETLVS